MKANNGETMRLLALAGVGIVRLSRFHIGGDITDGRLVPVLEEYNPGDVEPVHAVYMGHEHLSNRIRAFVDFLAEQLASRPHPASASP
jgi:DNA-binding transcriptional LysR family regulator